MLLLALWLINTIAWLVIVKYDINSDLLATTKILKGGRCNSLVLLYIDWYGMLRIAYCIADISKLWKVWIFTQAYRPRIQYWFQNSRHLIKEIDFKLFTSQYVCLSIVIIIKRSHNNRNSVLLGNVFSEAVQYFYS